VFETEYHVNSVILKLHSNYFRRFFDSPDKPQRPEGTPFRYEYITVLDEDGTWALEASPEPQKGNEVIEEYLSNSYVEEACFRYLLCAMYNQPYKFRFFEEIKVLTRIADFYCALPIVSGTLTSALMKSRIFEADALSFSDACGDLELIIVAKKLRNAELFRGCFVHEVGKYQYKVNPETSDPEIQALILREYNGICQKIMRAQRSSLQILVTQEMANALWSDTEPTLSAQFFRTLKCQVDVYATRFRGVPCARDPYLEELKEALQDLMVNNLRLDHSGFGSGENGDDNYFLCANIEDDEMPWDVDEIDW
ncbi:hypothetical protein BKA65DRAFT_581836, partial [Rhexocercosporidium sp. MPI-PUGE-AT-0058]